MVATVRNLTSASATSGDAESVPSRRFPPPHKILPDPPRDQAGLAFEVVPWAVELARLHSDDAADAPHPGVGVLLPAFVCRVADARLTNQGSGWTVSTANLKLKIAVTGTADSGDARLGALTLADGEGNAIALDPGFAAGTASYTAAVAHPVSSVAVTATAADTGATVSIANDDDDSTPGTAELGLEVGANRVTVTVTSEDAATTGSYTVTVTRAAAAPDPAPGAQTLIGNTGQKLHNSLGVRKAQRRVGIKFTTGDSTAAWKMTAIRMQVTAWHPDVAPTVRLRDASGGWPGTTIATLANPSPGTGSKTFMAPSGLKLQPNTTYAVVVAAGVRAGKFSLGITKSNHEDSGGAVGWSIADASRLDASGSWSSRPQSLMLAVQGAAVADDATPGGLTGWFASGPAKHDGSATFTVRIGFSDPIRISRSAMRDHAVQASGARVTSAKRVAKSGELWDIKTAPTGPGPVTLTVEGGRECSAAGAVCTADGRALADTLALTVPGPLALSVADASAREGPDSTVDFAVTLNRASSRPVTVGYRTADGSARAGEDYTATSGTLTFAAGVVQQTVSVPVLDDAIDEGEESFALALSNASGAVIADGGAAGTIVNSDPMPRAWIARFGRTVASQTVDAIGKRLAGGGSSRITVGGVALGGPGNAPDPEREGERDRGLADFDNPRHAGFTRTMSPRELLLGSAFRLSGGEDGSSSAWTAWGRIASSGFSAAEDRVKLDGDVTSGFFGVDLSRQRWLAGLAVSVSEGEGSFEPVGDGMSEDKGKIRSGLKGVFPYARYRVTEKLDVWGLVGYGRGELTLIELADANRPQDVMTKTGLSMRMGAIGTYGVVFSAAETGGVALAVRSDAFWVRMESEAVESQLSGRMEGSTGDATRLRVVVQGSRSFELEADGSFTPSLEVGIRHDGGDAETGAGIEVGAGARFARRGFAVEGAVNRLFMHEDGDYEQWGASGSVRVDSGAGGQGLSVSLMPAWGAASRGADRLWSLANTRDFAPDGDYGARWSLETEIGYGYRLSATEGVLTPYAGLSLAGAGNRSYRAGASWKIRPQTTLRMQAVRDGGLGGAPPAYSLAIRAVTRW